MKWSEFFVTGEPLIYAADVAIVLTMVGIVFVLTYFKKWKWLWNEWLTTVDHKKIGVMYIICAVLMLFRGGVDALLMRAQLTAPNMKFLDAQHYNEIFTTHGTIMILFMAMPFIIGLMNIVVPLQIGARDVAFPYLNALSFWLFSSARCCLTFRSSSADRRMPVGRRTSRLPATNSAMASATITMPLPCKFPGSGR
ncbi:hypothetical protein DI43_18825 [Geobacillus sp. CAMR12739]|nr:hypothetical protein DI43_18825 [Geobacillus sp. CAMR12739]